MVVGKRSWALNAQKECHCRRNWQGECERAAGRMRASAGGVRIRHQPTTSLRAERQVNFTSSSLVRSTPACDLFAANERGFCGGSQHVCDGGLQLPTARDCLFVVTSTSSAANSGPVSFYAVRARCQSMSKRRSGFRR